MGFQPSRSQPTRYPNRSDPNPSHPNRAVSHGPHIPWPRQISSDMMQCRIPDLLWSSYPGPIAGLVASSSSVATLPPIPDNTTLHLVRALVLRIVHIASTAEFASAMRHTMLAHRWQCRPCGADGHKLADTTQPQRTLPWNARQPLSCDLQQSNCYLT